MALDHDTQLLKELPLSLRVVREIHQQLMTGVRGGGPVLPGRSRFRLGRPTAQIPLGKIKDRRDVLSSGRVSAKANRPSKPAEEIVAAAARWPDHFFGLALGAFVLAVPSLSTLFFRSFALFLTCSD